LTAANEFALTPKSIITRRKPNHEAFSMDVFAGPDHVNNRGGLCRQFSLPFQAPGRLQHCMRPGQRLHGSQMSFLRAFPETWRESGSLVQGVLTVVPIWQ